MSTWTAQKPSWAQSSCKQPLTIIAGHWYPVQCPITHSTITNHQLPNHRLHGRMAHPQHRLTGARIHAYIKRHTHSAAPENAKLALQTGLQGNSHATHSLALQLQQTELPKLTSQPAPTPQASSTF